MLGRSQFLPVDGRETAIWTLASPMEVLGNIVTAITPRTGGSRVKTAQVKLALSS